MVTGMVPDLDPWDVSSIMTSNLESLRRTPLHDLHVALGAKMVPFAGYDMPVQYPTGILAEHLHTRRAAGLFDVSHMGQIRLLGSSYETIAAQLERLCPGDFLALRPGRQRYSFFTNEAGGIQDDLMATRLVDAGHGDHLFMVVNAGCKAQDFAHLQAHLGQSCAALELPDRALLALQGPAAATVLSRLAPDAAAMTFMSARALDIDGAECFVTRSGYTGEDGFEISVSNDRAVDLAKRLLDQPEVKPIGLGARDSLRLEAGLCLYGSDITTVTSPIEADLLWAIGKRRREQGGFPGAEIILRQMASGPDRLRVAILPDGRAPARAHTLIVDDGGQSIGEITSGGFSPSLERPIAMGYVRRDFATAGKSVQLLVRDKALPAKISSMPFVPHRYVRSTQK
jgi:aminomethyltransferase